MALQFLAIYLLGYKLTQLFGLRSYLERLGLSFLLGSGLYTFLLFFLHTQFSFSLSKHLSLITAITLLVLITSSEVQILKNLAKDFQRIILAFKKSLKSRKNILPVIIISFIFFTGLFNNFIWPITDWDSLALYDFRAKVMIIDESIKTGLDLGYYYQYPPYTSFLHFMMYQSEFPQVKIVYSAIYLSFIISFYALLRKKVDKNIALFFTALLSINPLIFEHSHIAYTNLAYTSFFVLGSIYAWHSIEEKKQRLLILATLLIALSTWTRNTEPFWLISLFYLGLHLWQERKKTIAFLPYLMVSLGITFLFKTIWVHFLIDLSQSVQAQAQTAVEAKIEYSGVLDRFIQALPAGIKEQIRYIIIIFTKGRSFETAGRVLSYLHSYIFSTAYYLLIPFSIALYREFKLRRKVLVLPITTLAILFAVLVVGTYLFSLTFETWHQIGGSAQRMSMFIAPLILYIIACSKLVKEIHDNWT